MKATFSLLPLEMKILCSCSLKILRRSHQTATSYLTTYPVLPSEFVFYPTFKKRFGRINFFDVVNKDYTQELAFQREAAVAEQAVEEPTPTPAQQQELKGFL